MLCVTGGGGVDGFAAVRQDTAGELPCALLRTAGRSGVVNPAGGVSKECEEAPLINGGGGGGGGGGAEISVALTTVEGLFVVDSVGGTGG